MRWLLIGTNITPAAREAMTRHEQKTFLPAEAGLGEDASLESILATARKQQMEIFTTDATLTRLVTERGIGRGRLMVFLQLSGADVEQDDAIDRLFKRYRRLSPGKLYTVTETRVKVRQFGSQKITRHEQAQHEAELESSPDDSSDEISE